MSVTAVKKPFNLVGRLFSFSKKVKFLSGPISSCRQLKNHENELLRENFKIKVRFRFFTFSE